MIKEVSRIKKCPKTRTPLGHCLELTAAIPLLKIEMTQQVLEKGLTKMMGSTPAELVIPREKLFNGVSHLFRGVEHGDIPISFFWGEYSLGQGPRLRQHPYAEIHIVQEGRVAFTLGERKLQVDDGYIVIVPGNTPHRFVNSSNQTLKMISIHCSGKLITEYLSWE
jgi:mannose-6-phosphate isomerase-like protein (cupin superfamily)